MVQGTSQPVIETSQLVELMKFTRYIIRSKDGKQFLGYHGPVDTPTWALMFESKHIAAGFWDNRPWDEWEIQQVSCTLETNDEEF